MAFGVQAVGSRKVDQGGIEVGCYLAAAGFLINRNPGKIAYLLLKSRKVVEQRTFSAVGIAHQCYVDMLCQVWLQI